MLVLLSPAKSLRAPETFPATTTSPRLKKKTAELVSQLKELSVEELKKLMKLSDALARLNFERYQAFDPDSYNKSNSFPAGLAFNGAVYQGLELNQMDKAQLAKAQARIRILSGLYGVLRPLDMIQAYRLEMGTKMAVNGAKNLYEFWGDSITQLLNQDLQKVSPKVVVNLASKEYYKSVNFDRLDGEVLTIDFREERNGRYKFITYNAKKARGMMASYIVRHDISRKGDLKGFIEDGYSFNESISTADTWIFTR